ncbi:hypothetical protein B0H16DRAFT_1804290 [Mycena metata]|uniref:Uncharacterized protein n=1 Tax=Mycena metata TaxID=1033252 RepID=A0AAD7JH56_9AGAR|nr:hypothetical protein B0H16DRAFT_1804290 [Mycena metata]
MFFSASIALTFILSLSGIAVRSAPVKNTARADFVPKACSGPNGTGTCVELGVTQGLGRGTCTNVEDPASLILNEDNDCVSLPHPDCFLDFNNPSDIAVEHFSTDKDINNLAPGIKSLSCQAAP